MCIRDRDAVSGATKAANEAAVKANTSAGNADKATTAANNAAKSANDAAGTAGAATEAAKKATDAANGAASNATNAATKASSAADTANKLTNGEYLFAKAVAGRNSLSWLQVNDNGSVTLYVSTLGKDYPSRPRFHKR